MSKLDSMVFKRRPLIGDGMLSTVSVDLSDTLASNSFLGELE